MIKIKLIESDQKKEYPEVLGATLLSKEEHEKYKNNIPQIMYCWWLRSAGYYCDSACVIDDYGKVNDYYVDFTRSGVRPVLILNPQSSNLKAGDKFEFGNYSFTTILNNLAICDDFIGEGCFRKDFNAEDANVYEKSDIKKTVDEWFAKSLSKSPDFWTENNIDIVIDNCEDPEYMARALEFKHQLGKIGDRMDKLNKELNILDMSDEEFQEYVKNHPEEFKGI